MQRESAPSPLPPVSVFGPNKFSSAPPITSSYFLSGTALRKQSELRVRRAGQPAAHTATGRKWRQKGKVETHTYVYTHICTACQVKHLQSDSGCVPKKNSNVPSNVSQREELGLFQTFAHTNKTPSPQMIPICCFLRNTQPLR